MPSSANSSSGSRLLCHPNLQAVFPIADCAGASILRNMKQWILSTPCVGRADPNNQEICSWNPSNVLCYQASFLFTLPPRRGNRVSRIARKIPSRTIAPRDDWLARTLNRKGVCAKKTHTHTHAHTHTHTHAHTHTHTHAHTHTHTHAHTHTCVCIYTIYLYTHKHTHTHIFIYIYIYFM